MTHLAEVKSKISNNKRTLDIFPTEELIKAWESKTGKEFSLEAGETARSLSNYASAMLDTKTTIRLISDLGIKGTVVLKNLKGRQYIIFKGYAGNRSIFTASRYLAKNPKVIDMAIGKVGVNKSIISGARVTVFLIVPLNILNYILDDQQTMFRLLGTTATDLIKVGAGAAVASLLATSVATITTIAAGPLVVAIAIGIATGYTLDLLDQKFGVTEALVKALSEAHYNTIGELGRQMNKVENHLKWQIMNGKPVGRGIFY
jgi:hypothetical protein